MRTGLGEDGQVFEAEEIAPVGDVCFMDELVEHFEGLVIDLRPGNAAYLCRHQILPDKPEPRPQDEPAIGHGIQGEGGFCQLDGRPGWKNQDAGPEPDAACPRRRPPT